MSEYNHACLTCCQKFLPWPNFYHPGPLCFLLQKLPLLAFCASGSSAVCVLCLMKFCMCFVPLEVLLYVFFCLRKFYCMCFVPQEVLLCMFCASGSFNVCFLPLEVLMYNLEAGSSAVCVLCLRKLYCMCFVPRTHCMFCASGSSTVCVLCPGNYTVCVLCPESYTAFSASAQEIHCT